jgi:hypothetical protein
MRWAVTGNARACGSCFLAAVLASVAGTAGASTLKPTHLKGLRQVSLYVHVDRDLEGYAALEREFVARVEAILAKDGISTAGSDTTSLSVQVMTYPGGNRLSSDVVLVSVSVELTEQVKLLRDPSLKIPGHNGAVTWSSRWIGAESKGDLRAAVERDIDLRVGNFAADVKYINTIK